MKNRLKAFLISIYLIFRRRKFNRLIGIISRIRKSSYIPPDDGLLERYRTLWGPVSNHLSTKWLTHFCSSTGRQDERFVAPDLYYIHLEPALNNYKMLKAYADKNFYDTLYPEIKKPAVFVRCIDGCFFDRHYQRISDQLVKGGFPGEQLFDKGSADLIVKPSIDSGQGRGVAHIVIKEGRLYRKDGTLTNLDELCRIYRGNFVIQELISQHALTARFNPSSLNSIRVYTYRSFRDDEIIPLHFMQRIGSPGSLTDGTFSIGLDKEGNYGTHCYDNAGRSQTSLNGLELATLKKFPFMDSLGDVAIKVAEKNIHSRVLGIDLVVDKQGLVLLIEVNNQSIGVNKVQLTGGPLFKEYTEEVINYCHNKRRTFAFYADY